MQHGANRDIERLICGVNGGKEDLNEVVHTASAHTFSHAQICPYDEDELALLAIACEGLDFSQVLSIFLVIGFVVVAVSARSGVSVTYVGIIRLRDRLAKNSYRPRLTNVVASQAGDYCRCNGYGRDGGWPAVLLNARHLPSLRLDEGLRRVQAADVSRG